MPSDLHFLIRNALTGVVFMLWCLMGLAAHDLVRGMVEGGTCTLETIIQSGCGTGSATGSLLPAVSSIGATFALALALVIGVAIHGLHLALRLAAKRREKGPAPMFDDQARGLVASEVLARARQLGGEGAAELERNVERVRDDDSVFVYAYHSLANAYMIEWARRRRSYSYIGVNWVWATGLGLACGGLTMPFLRLAPAWQLAIGAVVTLVLVFVAVLVGREMKRDADKMELIWAYSYRNRALGEALLPPAKQ